MIKTKINPRIGWRIIGEEAILFNCDTQEICILNESGSCLWKMISEGKDFFELSMFLREKYLLQSGRAEKDVTAFLKQLRLAGYIDFDGSQRRFTGFEKLGKAEDVLIELEMRAIEKIIPFSVTFETTYNCNENCIHCYMDKSLPSLRLPEIKRTLEEIAKKDCLFLTLTGGEFFARVDFNEILNYASRLHFVIDILSNGTLITQGVAESLTKYSVRRVQVTLCGSTPEIHDKVTGLKGSFNKTLNAIRLLRDVGIKVEVAFPLMGLNFHERYSVKQLVESLGCLFFPSHIITARNNGSKDTFQLRLNEDQLKNFLSDRELFRLYGGRRPFQDHQFYLNIPDIQEAAPCYSGFNTCAITPTGKVLPCNQLLYEVGDLRRESFNRVWKYSPQLKYVRSLKISDLRICSDCEYLRFCSRCPGLALLEGGNLLGISPENCRITKSSCELLQKGGIP